MYGSVLSIQKCFGICLRYLNIYIYESFILLQVLLRSLTTRSAESDKSYVVKNRKLTWNQQIGVWKRIFQTEGIIFGGGAQPLENYGLEDYLFYLCGGIILRNFDIFTYGKQKTRRGLLRIREKSSPKQIYSCTHAQTSPAATTIQRKCTERNRPNHDLSTRFLLMEHIPATIKSIKPFLRDTDMVASKPELFGLIPGES